MFDRKTTMVVLISLSVNAFSYMTLVDKGFKILPAVFLAYFCVISGQVIVMSVINIIGRKNSRNRLDVIITDSMYELTKLTGVLTGTALFITLKKMGISKDVILYMTLTIIEIIASVYLYFARKTYEKRENRAMIDAPNDAEFFVRPFVDNK